MLSTSANNQQLLDNFLARIEKKCQEEGLSLARVMADLLSVSQSVAYKKIKKEVGISATELLALAQHFDVPIIPKPGEDVAFAIPHLEQQINNPQQFLEGLVLQISSLAVEELNPKIFYATSEMPIWYYMKFRELTVLKMYIASITVWNIPESGEEEVSIESILKDSAMNELRVKIFNAFCALNTVEYYPINMLDNTLNQIGFLLTTGKIDREFAIHVFDQVEELVDWMLSSAETGHKQNTSGDAVGDYTLYFNEMVYTNNIVLVENDKESVVFTTLDNPNYLMTHSRRVVAYFQKWFANMNHRSIIISKEAERERIVYFNTLKDRIQRVRNSV